MVKLKERHAIISIAQVLKKRPELLIHEISQDLFESCHILVSQKDLENIQFYTLSL